MTEHPVTRYAPCGDLHLAYQTLGAGAETVVILLPFRIPMEQVWEIPQIAESIERLARFSRVVLHDRRGTGESDPLDEPVSIEDWVKDVMSVMDAIGVQRAWMLGVGMGAAIGVLCAATKPDRTSGLVLISPVPRTRPGHDFPWGIENVDAWSERVRQLWGTGTETPWRIDENPELQEELDRWIARGERHTSSPRGLQSLFESYRRIDVTDVLEAVHAPTLVVGYHGDFANTWEITQYVAERIPGAELHESPSLEFFAFAPDRQEILDHIEAFITGTTPVVQVDRVLATVLFTDIVDSTKVVARAGDRAWRSLLDRHDRVIDDLLRRFAGQRVKHTGDGVLATFDGPARAVRCAEAIATAVRSVGVDIRAGVHVGEIERRGDDIMGIAVHIGQRVASLAGPGEVLVSRTVTDLVAGSGIAFVDRGEHELKGVPGTWPLFAVTATTAQ